MISSFFHIIRNVLSSQSINYMKAFLTIFLGWGAGKFLEVE